MAIINSNEVSWGLPVEAGERYWVHLTATTHEIGSLCKVLAQASVEFTFEPYPDDEYEITVKADQRASLDRVIEITRLPS